MEKQRSLATSGAKLSPISNSDSRGKRYGLFIQDGHIIELVGGGLSARLIPPTITVDHRINPKEHRFINTCSTGKTARQCDAVVG